MLRISLCFPLIFLCMPLHAKRDLHGEKCFSRFTEQDPEVFFRDNLFDMEGFKTCSLTFLKEWDREPKKIMELPFLTAMQGLRAIMAVTRYDEEEHIVSAAKGKRLHKRLDILAGWLQKETRTAKRTFLHLVAATKWNPQEETFFVFTNAILLGSAVLKGLPMHLHQFYPEDFFLHEKQFKKTNLLADAMENKIKCLTAILAKRQVLLFPEQREKIQAAIASHYNPYYPEGGVHMIAGGIFRNALSDSFEAQMQDAELDSSLFKNLFSRCQSPHVYLYAETKREHSFEVPEDPLS